MTTMAWGLGLWTLLRVGVGSGAQRRYRKTRTAAFPQGRAHSPPPRQTHKHRRGAGGARSFLRVVCSVALCSPHLARRRSCCLVVTLHRAASLLSPPRGVSRLLFTYRSTRARVCVPPLAIRPRDPCHRHTISPSRHLAVSGPDLRSRCRVVAPTWYVRGALLLSPSHPGASTTSCIVAAAPCRGSARVLHHACLLTGARAAIDRSASRVAARVPDRRAPPPSPSPPPPPYYTTALSRVTMADSSEQKPQLCIGGCGFFGYEPRSSVLRRPRWLRRS